MCLAGCMTHHLWGVMLSMEDRSWLFTFNVKFYPSCASQMTESISRYLLCLQIRADIVSGRLPCPPVTRALLESYTIQAERGNYVDDEVLNKIKPHNDYYFGSIDTKKMEDLVLNFYKAHIGIASAEADYQFIEHARGLPMYGVHLHEAKNIKLGVSGNGVFIYKEELTFCRFDWGNIAKVSCKGSEFLLRLRLEEKNKFDGTITFQMPSPQAAKRFWKQCVEQHTFFRLEQAPKARFLAWYKFKYSGRTLAQVCQANAFTRRETPTVKRTPPMYIYAPFIEDEIGPLDKCYEGRSWRDNIKWPWRRHLCHRITQGQQKDTKRTKVLHFLKETEARSDRPTPLSVAMAMILAANSAFKDKHLLMVDEDGKTPI
ncbi:band 4.1-like protein 2 [Nycticebus coucang]|uniref:band 4.1-like protein 2 n=1 Tax=Nycticebus coucang TaxID=9470 RepID=UPI00234E2609|nr:band 4.1-like protein 2 [Nycticebus coucang]